MFVELLIPRYLKACLLVLLAILSLSFVSTFAKILKLWLLYSRVVGRLLGRRLQKWRSKSTETSDVQICFWEDTLLDFACCVWQVAAVRAITKAPQYVVQLGTIKELQGPEPAPRRTFLASPLKPMLDCWHWTKGCLNVELCFISRCKFVRQAHI